MTELSAMVPIRRRPLWKRAIRAPLTWWRHYRICRNYVGGVAAAGLSARMTWLSLRPLLVALLVALPASADVVLVSAVTCSGGGHITAVVGNALRSVADGAMANGSANLDSATAAWVSGDVGRTVVVHGAGVGGAPLVAVIQSRTSATRVVLQGVTASATVSGRTVHVVGAQRTILLTTEQIVEPVPEDADELALLLWGKRQRSLGKTLVQMRGHVIMRDVP